MFHSSPKTKFPINDLLECISMTLIQLIMTYTSKYPNDKKCNHLKNVLHSLRDKLKFLRQYENKRSTFNVESIPKPQSDGTYSIGNNQMESTRIGHTYDNNNINNKNNFNKTWSVNANNTYDVMKTPKQKSKSRGTSLNKTFTLPSSINQFIPSVKSTPLEEYYIKRKFHKKSNNPSMNRTYAAGTSSFAQNQQLPNVSQRQKQQQLLSTTPIISYTIESNVPLKITPITTKNSHPTEFRSVKKSRLPVYKIPTLSSKQIRMMRK